METCRAAVITEHNKPLTIQQVQIPNLDPGSLLVKITASTLCGTDVHRWHGPLSEGDTLPIITGHEPCGYVEDIAGERTDILGNPVKRGDRIVWSYVACGSCYYCAVALQPCICPGRASWGHNRSDEHPYLLGSCAEYMYVPVHALGHPWGLTISCADILYNGIFERFPRVRIAFLEGGIAWLLLLLERLHASHETHFQYIPEGEFGVREEQDPAKQIRQLIKDGRLYLGVETEELTMPFAIKTVGNKPFLYSSDFPHEVTHESCKHDLGELMESGEISDDDKAALLCRNAETFYKLPL